MKIVKYSIGERVWVYGFEFEVIRTWVATFEDGFQVGRFEGKAITPSLVGTGYDGGIYSAPLRDA